MALAVKDRVKVTSTTAGTGTFTLGSAVLGYQDFSVIGDGNTTYYTIVGVGTAEWEVGIGTYGSLGGTLTRDTILESSNSGSAVNFSAGNKEVFVTYPAERAVYAVGSSVVAENNATIPIASGGTGQTTAANAINALVPTQAGNAGYFLTTNGTVVSWADIPEQPVVSSVSPTSYDGQAGASFTISGFNFVTGATVAFIGNDSTIYNAATTTFVNSGQITATTATDLTVANEPYGVRVTLPSGANTTFFAAIDAGAVPAWTTPSGSLGSVLKNTAVSFSVSATDPDSNPITYNVVSGALPSGVSLNSSTGAITGTAPSVLSDTVFSFTIRAEDLASNFTNRAFSITVLFNIAPVWSTASGSLGVVYDASRSVTTFTVLATDTPGDTIAYTVASGSLPAGASLNSSTGVISGFNAVGSNTTSNFTLRATDNNGAFSDRAFSITVNAPVVVAFSYTGSNQTFNVPAGVSRINAKLWGGGGGGWTWDGNAGTAGGGGFTSNTGFVVTPGESLNIIVAGGGAAKGTLPASPGGGRSAIQRSGVDILTAGGGGGSGGGFGAKGIGGAGGGSSGQNGNANLVGNGGTQNAVGTGVQNGSGNTGGGTTAYNPAASGGGFGGGGQGGGGGSQGGSPLCGGGGGYFGGGASTSGNTSGAAGGGSGFAGATGSGTTTTGSGGTPAGTGDPNYPGGNVGYGGVGGSQAGGNGYVRITY